VIEGLYRRGLLGIADTPAVADFVKSQGWKLGVSRFVAGETLDDVLKVMRTLQGEGLSTILDLLGEFVATEAGAEAMTSEILRTLDTLAHESAERYMSVKPTQLGLGVSFELALHNARRVAERAREVDARVCLDMENVHYVDGTLNLFRTLYEEGHHHLSTVLQSYLYRSMGDLEALLTLEPKPALRLVKGAYRESETVAFQDKRQVDGNYREMLYRGLEAGAHIGVATHDESIIREAEAFVRGAKAKHYEFQLLYGVKPALQRALVARGHKVRIYIPYGEDWYGYFSRRLAERPANLAFVLRGLLG
jgi:proline dehydrogenase